METSALESLESMIVFSHQRCRDFVDEIDVLWVDFLCTDQLSTEAQVNQSSL